MSNVVFYQVNTAEKSTGRIVAASKRCSTWHYGVSTVSNGSDMGASCRGEEHEVTLGWSVNSGKRQVLHNGKEIYYSIDRRAEGNFHFAWRYGDHVFNLIAYASAPSMKEIANYNRMQFDLKINGVSFNTLPKIYELGTEAAVRKCQFATDFRTDDECTRHAEDDYRKQHKNASTSNDPRIALFDNFTSDWMIGNSEQSQNLKKRRSLRKGLKKPVVDIGNIPKRRSLKDVMKRPVLLSSKAVHAQIE